MGKSHLIISTGITLSVLSLFNERITLPVAAVTIVSALLPDIDEPNSLLVSRAIPPSFLRFLRVVLVGLGVFIYFYGQTFAPWNALLAILVGSILVLPSRSLKKVVMILIGIVLILFGHVWTPWNIVIGSLLIICAILPHRGLTHTIYGLLGWMTLLFIATNGQEHVLWIAGGLSYLLHLLADSITKHGIRPIPPLDWRLKFSLMSTGTRKGALVEGGFVLLTFVLVFFVFFRHVSI